MEELKLDWVVKKDVVVYRSINSKSRAVARIWGLSKVWQLALNEKPKYVLEVISERFEKLGRREKDRVLLHELAHIPRTFSGALLPHTRKGKGSFQCRLREMVVRYKKKL